MIPPLVRYLVGRPVLAWRRRELRRFLALLPETRAAQERKLGVLLAGMRGSMFSREHGLAAVRSPADLRKALPIAGHERVEPYVERVKDGDYAALFAVGTRVLMLAQTSGTTAAAKLIPVTAAAFEEYRRSWTVWGCGVAADHPEVPFGGVLNLASSWCAATTAAGLPIGSISGLLFAAMHTTLRLTNVIPPLAATVPGAEARWYLAQRLALARADTMMVTTANPSTLIAFARQLDRDKEHLIRDLHDGTLHDAGRFPAAAVGGLRRRLGQRQPERARALEAAALAAGRLTPRVAWERLELLGVWAGGTLGPYLKMLPDLYGSIALRDHGLSASEGRMTIPLADGVAEGPLNVEGAFYEFVPLEAYGDAAPETLLAHELEVGRRYVVVVTTSGGLVRYDMADVVECRGREGMAPVLAFLHKCSQFANVTGEKVSAHQAVEAARLALAELGLAATEFVVAPRFGDPAHYVFLLEQPDAPADHQTLAAAVDRRLAAANVEYADKRRSGRLGPLAVELLPAGAFARRRAAKIAKSGGALEQYKHPFLVPDLACEPELGGGIV